MPDKAGDPPLPEVEPPASSPRGWLAAVSTAWLSVNVALAALAALLWFAPLSTRSSTPPPAHAPTPTAAPLAIPTVWQTPSVSAPPPSQSPSTATPSSASAGGGVKASPTPTTPQPAATAAPTATRPAPTGTPGNQN